MYKLMIADDEPVIRNGIASVIDWKKLDLKLVGMACDGKSALEISRKQHPDICLVDIMMPAINGLEFIRELKEIQPDAVVIIISGYDTFSYVKAAIKYEVHDYILKPVDEDELEKSLLGAIRRIGSRKKLEKTIDSINSNLAELYPERKRNIVKNIIGRRTQDSAPFSVDPGSKKLFKPWVGIMLIMKDSLKVSDSSRLLSQSETLIKLYEICTNEAFGNSSIIYVDIIPQGIIMVVESGSTAEYDSLKNELSGIILQKLGYSVAIHGRTSVEGPDHLSLIIEEVIKETSRDLSYSHMVKRIKDYIDENFCDPDISLTKVSSDAGISEAYISRKFKEEVGFSFTRYLEMKRIELAEKLLTDGNNLICEIASMVGYSSQHYFSTVFKKTVGCNPSDYLKGSRNEKKNR